MPKQVDPLTDIQIKNAKPQQKNYRLSDGQGLYLLVTKAGSKLWRLDYCFDGKRKTLSIGQYPTISLESARQKKKEAAEQVAKGIDPVVTNKIQRVLANLDLHSEDLPDS